MKCQIVQAIQPRWAFPTLLAAIGSRADQTSAFRTLQDKLPVKTRQHCGRCQDNYNKLMELSVKEEFWWGAELQLPSWAGYQSRQGPYGSIDKPGPSDGTVALIFAPEGRGLEPLDEQEKRSISWFEQNEPMVSDAVKAAIIDWCSPNSADRAARFDFADDFPNIRTDEDLKENVGLFAVNIHQIDLGGVPYVGYEFGCEWEAEHGLGVLMQGTRVVEVGFADTAIVLWKAEMDAEKVNLNPT